MNKMSKVWRVHVWRNWIDEMLEIIQVFHSYSARHWVASIWFFIYQLVVRDFEMFEMLRACHLKIPLPMKFSAGFTTRIRDQRIVICSCSSSKIFCFVFCSGLCSAEDYCSRTCIRYSFIPDSDSKPFLDSFGSNPFSFSVFFPCPSLRV